MKPLAGPGGKGRSPVLAGEHSGEPLFVCYLCEPSPRSARPATSRPAHRRGRPPAPACRTPSRGKKALALAQVVAMPSR